MRELISQEWHDGMMRMEARYGCLGLPYFAKARLSHACRKQVREWLIPHKGLVMRWLLSWSVRVEFHQNCLRAGPDDDTPVDGFVARGALFFWPKARP